MCCVVAVRAVDFISHWIWRTYLLILRMHCLPQLSWGNCPRSFLRHLHFEALDGVDHLEFFIHSPFNGKSDLYELSTVKGRVSSASQKKKINNAQEAFTILKSGTVKKVQPLSNPNNIIPKTAYTALTGSQSNVSLQVWIYTTNTFMLRSCGQLLQWQISNTLLIRGGLQFLCHYAASCVRSFVF